MKRVDVKALHAAMKLARAESDGRCRQIDGKLADGEPWADVAVFAAGHCQTIALSLKPWQPPPCWMTDVMPVDDMPSAGNVAAWELRRRLIDAGLSAFEPDPVAALAAHTAEQRTPPAAV
jgi:hypothetical protein